MENSISLDGTAPPGNSKSSSTTAASATGAPFSRILPEIAALPSIAVGAPWLGLGPADWAGARASHVRNGAYSVAEPGATNVYEVAVITSFALHTAATEPSKC